MNAEREDLASMPRPRRVPRGIRNHNPMNLKELEGDRTIWLGERATDDDPTFEEFEYVESGIRAGTKVLLRYYDAHNIRTIRQLVKRFAPGADQNNEEAYTRFLASWLEVDADAELDFRKFETMIELVEAIIWHENGPAPRGYQGRNDGTWYPRATIRRGVELAGLRAEEVTTPITKSPTANSAATIAVAGASVALPDVLAMMNTAKPLAEMDAPAFYRLAACVVIVALAIYVWRRRARKKAHEET